MEWKTLSINGSSVQVSSLGEIELPSGRKTVGFLSNGYRAITLAGQRYYVHRLVGMAFLGLTDEGVINHRDANRENNRVENLEATTLVLNSSVSRRGRTQKGDLWGLVVQPSGKYGVFKTVRKHTYYFGCFDLETAKHVRDEVERLVLGYSSLNNNFSVAELKVNPTAAKDLRKALVRQYRRKAA